MHTLLVCTCNFIVFLYFRLAIIDLWVRIRQFTAAEVDNFIKKRHTIISVLWFLCSLAIGLFVPTIGMAIDFIGALVAHFIFTFPGQFFNKLKELFFPFAALSEQR